jgi:polyribonucleotide nucleotidyltransferase
LIDKWSESAVIFFVSLQIPLLNPIAAVEVGLVGDKFIINPTKDEMQQSKLKMIVAGTKSAILMIEGSCDFLTEEQLIEAISLAHDSIAKLCITINLFRGKVGKNKKHDLVKKLPSDLLPSMDNIFGEEVQRCLQIANKQDRGKAMSDVENRIKQFFLLDRNARERQLKSDFIKKAPSLSEDDILEKVDSGAPIVLLTDDEDDVPIISDTADMKVNPAVIFEDEASELRNKLASVSCLCLRCDLSYLLVPFHIQFDLPFSETDIQKATKVLISRKLREMVLHTGRRPDGRGIEDVRPLSMEVGLLPGAHGSALFTRGETQALTTTTLGERLQFLELPCCIECVIFCRLKSYGSKI